MIVERLFGREPQIDEVFNLLLDPEVGWVTLTGSGGVGKTALARAVQNLLTQSGHDVSWIDAGDDVTTGLAEIIEKRVDGNKTVVVLDAFEGQEGDFSRVARLAEADADLTVLATSRTATFLTSETQYRLEPLEWHREAADVLSEAHPPAQALFMHHARRLLRDARSSDAATIIDALCARLEGLPLALIIAAHQLRTMSLTTLWRQVDSGGFINLRAPSDLEPRHKTLAAVVEEDIGRLDAETLAALAALAVFEGRITERDAAVVLGATVDVGPAHVLATISELVRRSLVHPIEDSHDPVTSYRMSALARDFVLSDPRFEGGIARAEDVRDARLLELVLDGESMVGPEAWVWSQRLDPVLDDIRAALRHLTAQRDSRALRLASGLRNHCLRRGLLEEGLEWLREAWAVAEQVSDAERLAALEARAVLTVAARSSSNAIDDLRACVMGWTEFGNDVARARIQVDYALAVFETKGIDSAMPLLEDSVAVLDAAGESWWAARARSLAGATAATDPAYRETAREYLDSAIAGFRKLGDHSYTNVPLQQLGRLLLEEGHDVQAAAVLQEGLRLTVGEQDSWNASIFHNLLAEVELARAHPATAAQHFEQGLRLADDIGAKPRYIWCLDGLAACFLELSSPLYACRLAGMASAFRDALDLQDWTEFPARPVDLSGVHVGIDQATYLTEWWAGARTPVGELLDRLPSMIDEAIAAGGAPSSGLSDLTRREMEVLRLIAGGYTSKAVATELFISIETVGRHISNIYRKIGASGRAEATVIAIRHGLL